MAIIEIILNHMAAKYRARQLFTAVEPFESVSHNKENNESHRKCAERTVGVFPAPLRKGLGLQWMAMNRVSTHSPASIKGKSAADCRSAAKSKIF